MSSKSGSLMIIGGSEDRTDHKTILERFVQQCGGKDAKILVLTAASTVPDKIWSQYDEAFSALGATQHSHLNVTDRAQASDAGVLQELESAAGIFVTGGAQKRLLDNTGEKPFTDALLAAHARGACIAGTSAGASALSAHMLVTGKAELQASKGVTSLDTGYGLLQNCVIDQHFSERQRLARLLSAVAENQHLIGFGIDENTALLLEKDGFEVMGAGAVTIIDGREAVSNVDRIADGECLEMAGVRMHLLPSGSRYGAGKAPPAQLAEIVKLIT